MTETQLDLSPLARPRQAATESDARHRPGRKWISRYLIPGVILAGFTILLLATAGQSFWPRPPVQVIPVVAKRAAVQESGTPLFQAAGWIEPRPTAINVPALAPGVIEELLVVAGQEIRQGEPVARLISIDAEIAVLRAEAALATAEADLNRALAGQRAARIRFEQPVHLQVELADARSLLARSETELANLPFRIETAAAVRDYAAQSVQGKRDAGKAVPSLVLQKAESEMATADARLRELRQQQPGLQREIAALAAKVAALESRLDLLVDERRGLDESEAQVLSATARRDAARLELQQSELVLQRNTIRAPIDGRVLKLVAAPGTRVMGIDTNAAHNSSTVVEMYDPDCLQVRADVRLEDIPLVEPGQPVRIETASVEQPIEGRVLRPTSSANIQKNTLEVKVELLKPPPAVRPEMLVTSTFLAPQRATTSDPPGVQTERLFVPTHLVVRDDNGPQIWIVDAGHRARCVRVETGPATHADLIEVVSGLRVTDKLIASDTARLIDGLRVRVTGEDPSIGR